MCLVFMIYVLRVILGDILFVGGCGKFFEGILDMMYFVFVIILFKLLGNIVSFDNYRNNIK